MTIKRSAIGDEYISCDWAKCKNEIDTDTNYEDGTPRDVGWDYWWGSIDNQWIHYCPVHASLVKGKPEEKFRTQPQPQGKQSAITTCFWRLDPDAMLALGAVLAFGENKYQYQDVALGDENWRLLAHRDHVDHALEHLVRYLKEVKDGAQPDDANAGQHLQHAFCRIMFALGSKP